MQPAGSPGSAQALRLSSAYQIALRRVAGNASSGLSACRRSPVPVRARNLSTSTASGQPARRKCKGVSFSDQASLRRLHCKGEPLMSSVAFRSTRRTGLAGTVRATRADEAGAAEFLTEKPPGGSSRAVLPAVIIACLGSFLFGYHLGVVNGSLDYIAADLGFIGDAVTAGFVVSVTLAGAALGSLSGGNLADKLGRRKTFQLNALPLILGTLLCANAASIAQMITGRAIVGLGIGLSSSLVPLYISEIAPTNMRGSLGSINQLTICLGILGALLAGLPLSGNPAWWRSMFSAAVVPAVLLIAGMFWAPESPRWLFSQGRTSEAASAAARLWGPEQAIGALAELKASAERDKGELEATWGDLFSPRYRRVVSIGAALLLFQQLSGINAVVYFSTTVFRKAGVTSDVAASALVGAANVLGTIVASYLMDRQGRKRLLITSFTGQALCMVLLSLGLTVPGLQALAGPVAVLGTVLYVLSFALGDGPVPAVLLPEIFASRIRSKAVALCLGVHWVSNFFIGLCFLGVVARLGVGTVYLGFASVCLVSVLFVNQYVVETKGKSLEEIERELNPVV